MRTLRWPLVLAVLTIACTGGEEAEPEMESGPTSADSVAMAAEAFDPTVFDTLTWESDEKAIERGSVVFSYSCSKCHGQRGFGDAGFVTGGDTLRPPSFHQTDWKYAEHPDSLRQLVFTGREGGMPHWGLEGLQYRDVDAVTRYIVESLRER